MKLTYYIFLIPTKWSHWFCNLFEHEIKMCDFYSKQNTGIRNSLEKTVVKLLWDIENIFFQKMSSFFYHGSSFDRTRGSGWAGLALAHPNILRKQKIGNPSLTTSKVIYKYLPTQILIASTSPEFELQIYAIILILISTNPSIYNIIRWVAWTMGQTNRRPSVWCSKYNFFHDFLQNSLQKSFQFIFSFFFIKLHK